MSIPPEFVEELRDRLSIAGVIGGRVRLQKRGRDHLGLCPFHKEKTPSFTVSEDKGFFHCLAGETAVATRDGTMTIAELAGKTVEVLSRGRQWVKARFRSFGRQELFRIDLSRNGVRKSLFATSGHRWFTRGRNSAVLTTDLRTGHRLESVLPPGRTQWPLSAKGVRHGIVFGDGTVQQRGTNKYGTVNLHGEKADDLVVWFSDYEPQEHLREGGERYIRAYGGRDFDRMKSLPSLSEDEGYLLGFLAGYLATDGHVAKDGTVMLNCKDEETLRGVREIATAVGIGTYGVTAQERRGYLRDEQPIYRVHFVVSTLAPAMFLRRRARERFARADKKFDRLRWSVVSVTKSERTEEVYCAVVPEHHAFALDDNILTGNCFGCGAHGDVVGFVMRSDNLSFPEAVERLARDVGLQVPATTPEERQREERRATLHSALEAAAAWFEAQLRAAAGRPGLDYLKRRGLQDETIARFRLGYAPEARTALKEGLTRSGASEALMLEAGLLIRPEDGRPTYDRFRGRVMFPITDRRGRVVAFGGRILDQGEPKYLNSPETPLFHKGRTLYGLAQASKAAREGGEIVVCEGYMDVIALAEGGFPGAVAPLGTALTEDQIAALWRLAPEPVLCFDGDAAGQRAAARAVERALPLLQPGKSLRFAMLPPGDDPDSLVRAQGGAAMAEILGAARPFIDVLWDQELAQRPTDTPERRSGFRQRLRERIRRIGDRAVYEDYRREIDRRLAAAFDPPSPALRRGGPLPTRRGAGSPTAALAEVGGMAARRGTGGLDRRPDELIVAILVNHPRLAAQHAEDLAGVSLRAGLDKLLSAIIDLAAAHPGLDAEAFQRHLTEVGFAEELQGLLTRTKHIKCTLAEAAAEEATAALQDVLRALRKRDLRRERDAAAARLGEDSTEEDFARFAAVRQVHLDDESGREDDAMAAPQPGRARTT